MDLWIKTQRGRLSKIVDILEPILDEWEKEEGYCLYGYNSCQLFVPLAMYKTKKRALEVLDEIQNRLMPKFKVDAAKAKYQGLDDNDVINLNVSADYRQIASDVYVMPKE